MTITIRLRLEKPCKLWTGGTYSNGYGYVQHNKKLEMAHRVAYAEHHGLSMDEIKGVCIRHKCDTPGCYEPTHLIAGTKGDNNRDRVHRGRSARGEHGRARLTADQVREIKRALAAGGKQVDLAKHYGVTTGAIKEIKRGNNWRHVC